MNFNDALKNTMDSMTAGRDIVSSAKKRAYGQRSIFAPRRHAIAAALIMAVMCTTAVSAAKTGWLTEMFPNADKYTDAIEEGSDYEIKADIEFEPAEACYGVNVSGLLSDGESLLMNFDITKDGRHFSAEEEGLCIDENMRYDSDKTGVNTHQGSYWGCTGILHCDSDGSRSRRIDTDCGINSGDVFTFDFSLSGEDGRFISGIGRLTVTIGEDVPKLSKTVRVDKTVYFRNRSVPYIMEKEAYIESITVSAVKIRINYKTKDNSNLYLIANDISLVTKDGENAVINPIYTSSCTTPLNPKDENGYMNNYLDIDTGAFIPAEEIKNISIGDTVIEVN